MRGRFRFRRGSSVLLTGIVSYLHSLCDDTEDTARNISHRPRMIFHCLNHHTHLLLLLTSFHLPYNIHSNAHLSSADIFRLYCCAYSTQAVSIPCTLPFLQTDQMCSWNLKSQFFWKLIFFFFFKVTFKKDTYFSLLHTIKLLRWTEAHIQGIQKPSALLCGAQSAVAVAANAATISGCSSWTKSAVA